jgi:tripartite-type tricarboxylate transporter receptor subunit TctC
MRKRTAFLTVALSALGIASAVFATHRLDVSEAAQADAYPDKPVTLVVTFPPGGGTDLLARRLGAHLENELGQTIVVENRAGASGNIGAQFVARAKADGYTLLVVNSSYSINPGVYRDLGFSPQKDLVGVVNVGFVPSVLVTAAKSSWQDFAQTLTPPSGSTSPAALSYASCGNGTPQHLAGEMLVRRAAVPWLHVPYRGCGPALVDVLAGNVALGMVTASSAMSHIQAGTLRALAVTSPQRSPLLPDVPTVAEQGFPGYQLDQWHGLLAPAGTPGAVIKRLNDVVTSIVQRPQVEQDLQALGYRTAADSSDAFQTMVQQDMARFGQLTSDMGLVAN